jgi:hypothetical protein
MTRTRSLSRTLSVILIFALFTFGFPMQALASEAASFTGTILAEDGLTPRAGVVVSLVHLADETQFAAPMTSEDGRFQVLNAPAGRYALIAETAEGAYLAAANLQWNAADNSDMLVTLVPAVQDDTDGSVPGDAPSQGRKAGMSKLTKSLILGALVITGVVLIEEVTSNSEQEVSSF